MSNIITPGKPLPPIIVETQAAPAVSVSSGDVRAIWGRIYGDIADQADLQAALAAAGGGGASDGDKGDITVSGSGATWTIDAGAVSLSKMANLAASTILGNNTGIAATPIALTAAQVKTLLSIAAGDVSGLATVATSGSASDLTTGTLPAARFNDTAHGSRAGGALHANVVAAGAAGFMTGADKTKLDGIATGATANSTDATLLARANHTGTQLAATISDFATAVAATAAVTANTAKVTNATHTGDVTGATALTIANDAVTYAKMQNVSAASRLLGRGDSGSGDPQEITLGTNLSMSGTTLNATGGGGASLTVQDEGSTLSTAVTSLNFTGAGVTATGTTSVTINIPGGGSSAFDYGQSLAFNARQFL